MLSHAHCCCYDFYLSCVSIRGPVYTLCGQWSADPMFSVTCQEGISFTPAPDKLFMSPKLTAHLHRYGVALSNSSLTWVTFRDVLSAQPRAYPWPSSKWLSGISLRLDQCRLRPGRWLCGGYFRLTHCWQWEWMRQGEEESIRKSRELTTVFMTSGGSVDEGSKKTYQQLSSLHPLQIPLSLVYRVSTLK